jgi:TetR/AcrR family transcriptional regulator, cholesterol catabolism regulator
MEVKDRILEAARELFFKYGIKSITMDDIAKHLAMSKKTIYQFYEDKNQLLNTLTKNLLLKNQYEIEEVTVSSKDAIHEIIQIMKHMDIMFSQMNPNLFYDMQKYHPVSWKQFKDFKNECIMEMVVKNLYKGVEQGLYRKDMDIKVIATLRLQEVEMAMDPFVFPPGKFSIASVQLALLDHFLHGITTIKGHKLINKYKQVEEEE